MPMLWSASGAGRCPKMHIAGGDREPRTVIVADNQPTVGVDGFKNAAPDNAVLRDCDRSADTGGRAAPEVEYVGNTAPVIPKAENLDPCIRERLEHLFGTALNAERAKRGCWIRRPFGRCNNIHATADDNGATAIRRFAGLQQDAGELGPVSKHVIGPFERNARAAISPVRTIDANAENAVWQHSGKATIERNASHEAKRCNQLRRRIGHDKQAGGEIARHTMPLATATAPPCILMAGCKPDATRIARSRSCERFAIGGADLVKASQPVSG